VGCFRKNYRLLTFCQSIGKLYIQKKNSLKGGLVMGVACFPSQGAGVLREASMLRGATRHTCDLSKGGQTHSSFGGKTFTGMLLYDRRQPGKKIEVALRKFSMFVCNDCLCGLPADILLKKAMKKGKIPRRLMKTKYFLRDLQRQLSLR
jgi:hypothetical protein